MLFEFEELFDGTLGDWKRPPVSIAMKEGAKPYHGRSYPIAQIHKATLMKEINRLEDRGTKEAIIITMGLSNIHHPKEGHDSAYYHQFSGA